MQINFFLTVWFHWYNVHQTIRSQRLFVVDCTSRWSHKELNWEHQCFRLYSLWKKQVHSQHDHTKVLTAEAQDNNTAYFERYLFFYSQLLSCPRLLLDLRKQKKKKKARLRQYFPGLFLWYDFPWLTCVCGFLMKFRHSSLCYWIKKEFQAKKSFRFSNFTHSCQVLF